MHARPSPAPFYRLVWRSRLTGCSRLAERFAIADFHYAHRGLWQPGGPAENSLEAFQAAASAGYGAEFDVRPAQCGTPMIFHDPLLDRLTDGSGLFASYSASELDGLTLAGGGKIPHLADLLEIWPGETPLLCELKIDGVTDFAAFAAAVAAQLSAYSGPIAAMSFSVPAIAALPPEIMRGQLISPRRRIGQVAWQDAMDRLSPERIDYLACYTSDAEAAGAWAAAHSMPMVVWTVTNAADSAKLAAQADALIFEGWMPDLPEGGRLNG